MGQIAVETLQPWIKASAKSENPVHYKEIEVKLSNLHVSDQVPVIDISGLDGPEHDQISRDIARACESWGFFQLINHGIDESLLERAKDVSRTFFKLPQEDKLEYKVGPATPDGWYSRDLTVNCNKLTHSIDHLFLVAAPASKKKVDRWPRYPPAYRETMAEYANEVRSLQEKLIDVLTETLGLQRGTLQERLAGGPSGEPTQSMRINFYSPAKDNGTEVGLDAHSDPGGITVLLQDEVAGLQVKKNNRWVEVDLIPNALVVNIADQLEILSNGRYKSVEHRGMAHRTLERLSLATFYSPNYEAVVGPVQQLVRDGDPVLYKSMKYADYFSSFVQRGLNGKEYVKAQQFASV